MAESTDSIKETENTSWTDPILRNSMEALHSVEEGLDSVTCGIGEVFHDHPKAGTIVCGGLGLGAAMVIGVAELAATLVTGYLGYRMLARGESFTEALEKSLQLRQGQLRKEDM